MKKLFTLIAAALLAVGVNAQTTLWESASGYTVKWSGNTDASVSKDKAENWKVGDEIHVTVSRKTADDDWPQVVIKTNAASDENIGSSVGLWSISESEFPYTAVFVLTAPAMNQIKENGFHVAGSAAVITKIEYVQGSVPVNTDYAIWLGSMVFPDESWWSAGNISIDKSMFADVEVGQILEFRASVCSDKFLVQACMNGWEDNGKYSVNASADEIAAKTISLQLDETQVSYLKEKGLIVQAGGCTLNAVALLPVAEVPATKDIDFSGMSSVWGGGSYDAGTKTITQGTGGVGLAWYSSQPDFSKYDYMVVEFAEPTKEKAKIAIVYNDNTNSGEAGAFNANCKRKVIALKDVSKSAILQIYVQGGSEGCTFVLSKMYVAKSDYITENNIVDEYALTDTESLSLVNLNAGWNANYDSSTKTITVKDGVDAGGKGWWFGESTGADYSHYDNVVIEFEPTTSEGNVEVQYNGAENKKVNFYLGATCVVIPLDATGKSNIKCIQIAGGPNDTFILKAAYVAISSKTPAEALGITWTVAGQELLMGRDSNWNEGDKKNNMTSTDGVNYTLVKEDVYLEQGGSYMYKVVQNHSWDNDSYGEDGKTDGSNAYLNISETGKYKLTFSFNSDTKKPTVTAVKTSDADVTIHDMYSVIGTIIGNWDTDTEMTKGDNGIFTATIANVNAGSYEFKVRVDKDWTFSYPSSNYQLTVDSDGSTVTFTYNPATYEVTATVTPATGIESLTINAHANALMYNLAGQRVDKDYKGVVIKNGRKVVVK